MPLLLLSLLLTGCALQPPAAPALVCGALMTDGSMSGSGGSAQWQVRLRGRDLLLDANGKGFEVRGATAAGRLDFVRDADTFEWQFAVPGEEALIWNGRDLVLGSRSWQAEAGRVRVDL